MCTRVALHSDADTIKLSLLTNNGLQIEEWDDSDEFQPRYNIGDKMRVPVLLYRTACGSISKKTTGGDTPAAFIMRSSRWRIIPDYCTIEDESRKTLEVSAENLVNGQGFGKIARTQTRCAVVCQGYYSFPPLRKQLPSYVRRQNEQLLLLAGICASAKIDGKELHSFAVVTTKASHGLPGKRQPVVLGTLSNLQMWLTQQSWTASLGDMISTPHNNALIPLESYPVPEGVRNLDVESPTFVQPIGSRRDGISSAFKVVERKNKRRAQDSPERTPPPGTPTPRDAPPSTSKRLRLTSPVPSPRKVPITSSKPIRVTQICRDSESPTPVARRTGPSSSSSRARGRDSDAEMDDVQYIGGLSETEDDVQYIGGLSETEDDVQYIGGLSETEDDVQYIGGLSETEDDVQYIGRLSETEDEDGSSTEAGPSTSKGKGRAIGSGARAGKSKFFS